METKLSEPIALFDLDGTLADFPGSMMHQLNILASPLETKSYYEEQADEPKYITERRRLIKRQPGFWAELPRYEPGFKILDMCTELEFKINILSKAPRTNFQAWAEKAEWCNKHLSLYPNIAISLVQDKGLHYGKVLVDDWPDYIKRWLEHRPRGLVIMPAHSYNLHFTHPNVIRYRTGENEIQVYQALEKIRELCQPL